MAEIQIHAEVHLFMLSVVLFFVLFCFVLCCFVLLFACLCFCSLRVVLCFVRCFVLVVFCFPVCTRARPLVPSDIATTAHRMLIGFY